MKSKIFKNLDNFSRIVAGYKKRGKIISAICGSFDFLHYGHVKILQKAKGNQKNKILIVLLNSDHSVRMYKGPGRPIISQQERASMLAVLECVDFVFIFNEINPIKILKLIKPNEYWNGSDWGENFIEREVIESNGGAIFIHNRNKSGSATKLMAKIFLLYSKPSIKAIFIDSSSYDRKKLSASLLKLVKEKGYKIFEITSDKNMAKVLVELAKKYKISLNKSWLISPNEQYIYNAKEVNARAIKIDVNSIPSKTHANNIVKSAVDAFQLILKE